MVKKTSVNKAKGLYNQVLIRNTIHSVRINRRNQTV